MFFQSAKSRRKPAALRPVLCLMKWHLPNRRAAKWDGLNYVTSCRHCGTRMRRKSRHDWRVDWMEPH